MKFTKMQGLGNDYVYVNGFEERIENPSEMAVKVSNRNFGVGSDGLILINPSEKADFEMEMYNADGSRERCVETEFVVWQNMFMIMVLPIRHIFLWRHWAGLNIWI